MGFSDLLRALYGTLNSVQCTASVGKTAPAVPAQVTGTAGVGKTTLAVH